MSVQLTGVQPHGFLRWGQRLPIWLYRWHLSWLLGETVPHCGIMPIKCGGGCSGVTVEEAVSEANVPCIDRRVSEVKWPHASVSATLRRGQRVLIP